MMNWITTNIRLPEDIYTDLKFKAVRERKSVAQIIRDRLGGSKKMISNPRKTLEGYKKLGMKIAKQNKGVNFGRGLVEMRYEQ